MRDETLTSRKNRHLEYFQRGCTDRGDPGFQGVSLRQSALSSVFPEEVQLQTSFLGATLGAPFFIAPITGGTPEGEAFNRAAARCAARLRLPMATGSLRVLFEQPETFSTFDVNAHGELPLFFGNLGAAAALRLGADRVRELCDRLRMDGLYIYFNHAQELVQPVAEHHRFELSELPEFITRLGLPVLIKETGMGFSPNDLSTISKWPVAGLDTSGAGGSNFFHVEWSNNLDSSENIWEIPLQMGIPTALVIHFANRYEFPIIGSGGIRSGLDMARAFALGADLISCAAPLVFAWSRDPEGGIDGWITDRLAQLRQVMSLCGAADPAALKLQPVTLAPGFGEAI